MSKARQNGDFPLKDSPEQQALHFFTLYMDGIITEADLINQLAELPKEVIERLPEPGQSWPPRKGFRASILNLQAAIAEGRTFLIKGS